MMEASASTHAGRVRYVNEDSFACETEIGFFVVADGLGGENAGERASQIAVNTLTALAREAGSSLDAGALIEAIEFANRRILREAELDPALTGMCTTVTAAIVRGSKALICNAGDSRAYRFADGSLQQLTKDHSWVQELADKAGCDPAEFKHHRRRQTLTKAVGYEETVEADTIESEFGPGDILLLCSDGLHGVTPAEAIVETLAGAGSLEEKADALVCATLARGAPDNVTALLVAHASDQDAD